jgi:hypothetical protein
MKVTGPGGPSATGPLRPSRPLGAGAGFSVPEPGGASESAAAGAAPSVSAVSSLEALIALQEVGNPLERRRRAVGRASAILDALETLKSDLLEGQLSVDGIGCLARAVREQRALTDDPALEDLLNEIETRAAVELAKIESQRAAA